MRIGDYAAELARAGANVEGRWGGARFLARRYPLGAIGAAIMAVFVFAAVFAEIITFQDPLATNASLSLARPSAVHWLGTDRLVIFPGIAISLVVFGTNLLGDAARDLLDPRQRT
jgi:peptide/nickel transport system permease protein